MCHNLVSPNHNLFRDTNLHVHNRSHSVNHQAIYNESYRSIWRVPLDYFPRDKQVTTEHTGSIYDVVKNLNPDHNIKDRLDLFEQIRGQYWSVIKYAKVKTKAQIVINCSIIDLEYGDEKIQTFHQVTKLFASEEGIKKHREIWQVRFRIYYIFIISCSDFLTHVFIV